MTNEDLLEQSQITASAISSGVPILLNSAHIDVSLLSRKAAVDQQTVADDERGLAGAEPNHGVGDFLRRADSADGVHGRHRRASFGLLPDKSAIHVGLDRRGQHGVDADALLAKFD